jgi:hypothetical protein
MMRRPDHFVVHVVSETEPVPLHPEYRRLETLWFVLGRTCYPTAVQSRTGDAATLSLRAPSPEAAQKARPAIGEDEPDNAVQ